MGIFDFMSAEPSQELDKPVPPQELARRRLVEIVDAETKRVLARTETRDTRIIFGASPATPALPGYLNLSVHFDSARLARVSPVQGVVSFLPDGTVVYGDNSQYGTVIERRPKVAFNGLPVLRFQVTNVGGVNNISAYLTRSAVTQEAECWNAVPFTTPNGLLLKNGDIVLPGFNYDVIKQSGVIHFVTGASGTNTLQPPAAVMQDRKLSVPRLTVYIR